MLGTTDSEHRPRSFRKTPLRADHDQGGGGVLNKVLCGEASPALRFNSSLFARQRSSQLYPFHSASHETKIVCECV